ncbi:hypothetical protein [Larkinella terrae]|uniref:Uncharacterized protein n=1 Tax=Larkinella terrae TaxID=2025311 RepID=A0A7K0EIS8_9BACT|nr:hypothetical protein [Larkinella terrae]MRS61632.1 hypothetical protein [Larkinella terrae]
MNIINPDWVKLVHLDYPKHSTYCASEFINTAGMTPRELIEVLAKGPIFDDNCIIEGIGINDLPDFVEAPEDRAVLSQMLENTGLTGSGRTFAESIDTDPYRYLGFERVMVTAQNHYVYKRNGVSYCSLGYTYTSYGVRVNAMFIAFLMSLDDDPGIDLIWFVTTTNRGVNESFDVLYDMRFQEYLIKIGRDYQARFVDMQENVPAPETLLETVTFDPLPEREPFTEPFDVLHERYHGDCRYESAISSGADEKKQMVALFTDDLDYSFRSWLVKPRTNMRRVYYNVEDLITWAGDDAPKVMQLVLGELKKQIIEHEFYEYMPRFEKGLVMISKRGGITIKIDE